MQVLGDNKMNSGQEKFFNFIMERVNDQDKAKELLSESFAKQANGGFNQEYLMSFIPRMMAIVKPEFMDEVKNIMINYQK